MAAATTTSTPSGRAFPDCWIDRGEEGPELSRYVLRKDSRWLELSLVPRADADDGLVALASMVSKFLRECWMGAFNAHWRGPDSRPEADGGLSGRCEAVSRGDRASVRGAGADVEAVVADEVEGITETSRIPQRSCHDRRHGDCLWEPRCRTSTQDRDNLLRPENGVGRLKPPGPIRHPRTQPPEWARHPPGASRSPRGCSREVPGGSSPCE